MNRIAATATKILRLLPRATLILMLLAVVPVVDDLLARRR